MPIMGERVDRLETVLGEFIVQTNTALIVELSMERKKGNWVKKTTGRGVLSDYVRDY